MPISNFRLPNFDFSIIAVFACWFRSVRTRHSDKVLKSAISNGQSAMLSLRLFMLSMLPTAPAELAKRKSFRSCFLVLGGDVVATLAVTALKHNIIPRHDSSL